jgi:hypothetical protein
MVIVIIIITIFVALRITNDSDGVEKTIKQQDAIEKMKTGDVIGISYSSFRGQLVKSFTGSGWSHVGIIVKRDDGVYVMEMGRYNQTERGFLLKPLEDWLDYNDGRMIAWRSYQGDLNQADVESFIKQHRGISEDMFVVSWLKSMVKLPYSDDRKKDKYYCSEMAARFLQQLGVLKKRYQPSGYKPWELIHSELPLNTGHAYSTPLLII